MSAQLISKYFEAFNARDAASMLELLAEDVAHDINQGGTELGKARFATFLQHMDSCYREQLVDMVLMSDGSGTRVAAEYTVLGTYLATDNGFPEAKGQTYRLPAGSFFEVTDGKIQRVTTYYNLRAWLAQVNGAAA